MQRVRQVERFKVPLQHLCSEGARLPVVRVHLMNGGHEALYVLRWDMVVTVHEPPLAARRIVAHDPRFQAGLAGWLVSRAFDLPRSTSLAGGHCSIRPSAGVDRGTHVNAPGTPKNVASTRNVPRKQIDDEKTANSGRSGGPAGSDFTSTLVSLVALNAVPPIPKI